MAKQQTPDQILQDCITFFKSSSPDVQDSINFDAVARYAKVSKKPHKVEAYQKYLVGGKSLAALTARAVIRAGLLPYDVASQIFGIFAFESYPSNLWEQDIIYQFMGKMILTDRPTKTLAKNAARFFAMTQYNRQLTASIEAGKQVPAKAVPFGIEMVFNVDPVVLAVIHYAELAELKETKAAYAGDNHICRMIETKYYPNKEKEIESLAVSQDQYEQVFILHEQTAKDTVQEIKAAAKARSKGLLTWNRKATKPKAQKPPQTEWKKARHDLACQKAYHIDINELQLEIDSLKSDNNHDRNRIGEERLNIARYNKEKTDPDRDPKTRPNSSIESGIKTAEAIIAEYQDKIATRNQEIAAKKELISNLWSKNVAIEQNWPTGIHVDDFSRQYIGDLEAIKQDIADSICRSLDRLHYLTPFCFDQWGFPADQLGTDSKDRNARYSIDESHSLIKGIVTMQDRLNNLAGESVAIEYQPGKYDRSTPESIRYADDKKHSWSRRGDTMTTKQKTTDTSNLAKAMIDRVVAGESVEAVIADQLSNGSPNIPASKPGKPSEKYSMIKPNKPKKSAIQKAAKIALKATYEDYHQCKPGSLYCSVATKDQHKLYTLINRVIVKLEDMIESGAFEGLNKDSKAAYLADHIDNQYSTVIEPLQQSVTTEPDSGQVETLARKYRTLDRNLNRLLAELDNPSESRQLAA